MSHTLVADKDMANTGLLGIIRKADRFFEPISPGGFRAVNRDGFMVDLIKSEPKQLLNTETRRMGGPDDLEAVEIRNLQWLISSPKFSHVVIGEDGYPALFKIRCWTFDVRRSSFKPARRALSS